MTDKLVTVYINDIEVKVLENSTILQACEKIGVKVPRFCYHEKLSIAGNCRMCLVEIKNAPKLQASCALPVMKDARIYTDSIAVRKAREGIMELLLINHPLDCPICDQGGECDLQDQAMYYGSDHGRFNEYKRATSDKNFGPLIKTIMTRCIHCTRCVRFATEVAGCPELGTIGRGSNMEISTFARTNEHAIQSVLDSELSGNLIDLCPVGALTSLPYAFVARPWELKSIVSVDVSDSYCSDIKVDIRGQGPGSVLRVLPATANSSAWISDKTRFSYDGLKRQRLITPIHKKATFEATTWDELFASNGRFSQVANKVNSISLFLGNHVDLDTLQVIQTFVKNTNKKVSIQFIHPDSNRYSNNLSPDVSNYTSYAELSETGSGASSKIISILKDKELDFINEKELEKATRCLLIGTNPRLESPVLNASLQKVAKRGVVALFGSNSDRLPYPVKHLGNSPTSVLKFMNSSVEHIGKVLKLSDLSTNTSKSSGIILIGSAVLYRPDALEFITQLNAFASKYNFGKVKVLYQSVSELSGLSLGFDVFDNYSQQSFVDVKNADLVIYHNLPNYSLNNPLIKESLTRKDSVRVFVGSHGNELTNKCQFVFPTAVFTEKTSSYVNTCGYVKKTTMVTYPPGAAIQDNLLFEKVFKCL